MRSFLQCIVCGSCLLPFASAWFQTFSLPFRRVPASVYSRWKRRPWWRAVENLIAPVDVAHGTASEQPGDVEALWGATTVLDATARRLPSEKAMFALMCSYMSAQPIHERPSRLYSFAFKISKEELP